uniref:TIGR00297 family protein n=1 Tax=Methanococcus maripaludis (strain C6 / ATCC BAA-1332) TaxID=444158 RepID=A9A6M2_METM6
MDMLLKIIYSASITLILAALIHKKKYLDKLGIVGSSIMAFTILFLADLKWLLLLITFLVLGSLVSKMGYGFKKTIKMAESRRSLKNVLANGLMAVLFVLAYSTGLITEEMALVGYIGAIAAANSDTFSSELGMLSRETPRLITNFKIAKTGTDGAITVCGTFAGLLGSFLIGILAYALFNDTAIFWTATISGMIGNFADSLLGAVFERKGLMNNEHVNFMATLSGGTFAVLFYQLII